MTEIDARESAKQEVARQTAHLGGWHPELVGGLRAGFELGAQWAVEQLPSKDAIGEKLKADTRLCYPDGAPVDWPKLGDAVLALIRERYNS